MKTLKQLQLIKKVYDKLNNQLLNPLELNEVFNLISNEQPNPLHSKRAKILTLNRYMQLQYEKDLSVATQVEIMDDIFTEETYEDYEENSIDETQTALPEDEITVSPKKKGRKSTHKE